MNIALDGPSGAGKSTVAKAVAKRLGLVYVDTGAMYRTIGLFALRSGIDLTNGAEKIVDLLPNCSVSLAYEEDGQHVYLNDEDVSSEIRTPEVSKAASCVSAIQKVRDFLLGLQHDMVEKVGVIMDGRDIGTVIMPDADAKIFLIASDEARAKRRYLELKEKGQDVSLDEILQSIIERDKRDRERDTSPCVPADDAVILDSSDINFDETVEAVIRIIEERTK